MGVVLVMGVAMPRLLELVLQPLDLVVRVLLALVDPALLALVDPAQLALAEPGLEGAAPEGVDDRGDVPEPELMPVSPQLGEPALDQDRVEYAQSQRVSTMLYYPNSGVAEDFYLATQAVLRAVEVNAAVLPGGRGKGPTI